MPKRVGKPQLYVKYDTWSDEDWQTALSVYTETGQASLAHKASGIPADVIVRAVRLNKRIRADVNSAKMQVMAESKFVLLAKLDSLIDKVLEDANLGVDAILKLQKETHQELLNYLVGRIGNTPHIAIGKVNAVWPSDMAEREADVFSDYRELPEGD